MSGHRTQPRPDTSRATMMLMAESGNRISPTWDAV